MKNVRVVLSLVGVSAAVTMLACSHSSNPVGPSTPKEFPLYVGASRNYVGFTVDSNGVKIPGTEYKETDSVIGTEQFAGRLAYKMWINIDSTSFSTVRYAVTTAGDVDVFMDTSGNQGRGLWIPFATLSKSVTTPLSVTQYHDGSYPVVDTAGHVVHVDITATQTEFWRGFILQTVPAGIFSTRYNLDSVYLDAGSKFTLVSNCKLISRYFTASSGLIREEIADYNTITGSWRGARVRELSGFGG